MLKTIFIVTALSIGGLATLLAAVVSVIVSLQTKEEVRGKCIEHRQVASDKPGYYTYAPILVIDTPSGRRSRSFLSLLILKQSCTHNCTRLWLFN